MWVGFAVRHVAKKVAIGAAVVVGAALATKSGRRIARVLLATAKGAGEAAYMEIKEPRLKGRRIES
jgi:hypothetical protein